MEGMPAVYIVFLGIWFFDLIADLLMVGATGQLSKLDCI